MRICCFWIMIDMVAIFRRSHPRTDKNVEDLVSFYTDQQQNAKFVRVKICVGLLQSTYFPQESKRW